MAKWDEKPNNKITSVKKDKGQDKVKESGMPPNEISSWQKEGLYIFVSIIILFGIHVLITLVLIALL